jgi:hypothetical protein
MLRPGNEAIRDFRDLNFSKFPWSIDDLSRKIIAWRNWKASIEITIASYIHIKPIQIVLNGSEIWSTCPQQCFNFSFRPINVYARALVCVYIVSRFVVFRFSPAFSSFDVTASGTWCINITMFQGTLKRSIKSLQSSRSVWCLICILSFALMLWNLVSVETLFWSDSLIVSSSFDVVVSHIWTHANQELHRTSWRGISIWYRRDQMTFEWIRRLFLASPTMSYSSQQRVREREVKKDQSKNPPSHDIHDSKLYRITHKNGRSRNKPGGEETKTARVVFVKFIFHRGYNFST